MSAIILCNRPSRIQVSLRGVTGSFRFLNLAETRQSNQICAMLRSMPASREISKARLFRERSESFTNKYIRFIGEVNTRNSSWHWWAMQFTDKNPLTTSLCRDTFFFLLVSELARSSGEPLMVITDSPGLAIQVRHWAKQEGVNVVDTLKPDQPIKQALKNLTPSGTMRAFMRTLRLWVHYRRYWPIKDLSNDYMVITTLTHPQSFLENKGYKDAYFGELVDKVSDSQYRPLILAQMLERPFTQVKKLKTAEIDIPVVPVESCLTLRALVVCLFQALRLYIMPPRIIGAVEIDGLDLHPLVRLAVIDGRHSGDLFMALRIYAAAAALARRIRIARCIYPYENRSWEKMLLQGMRKSSPQTHLRGYQHAAITHGHTNFFLSPQEDQIMPLPDDVLTTGEVTRDWLDRDGNYPPGFFKTACALRQTQPDESLWKAAPKGIRNVLAVLASDVLEHVGALLYLSRAFRNVHDYQLRVRPHPSVPLESALEIAPLEGTRESHQFFSTSTGNLDDDLAWADVVLYASSTVAMEAIGRGIPVIHMDLGDFLDPDPLTGWDDFRWPVVEPSDLIGVLQSIESIPEQQFQDRQIKGRQYVSSYLRPITPDGLRAFWET